MSIQGIFRRSLLAAVGIGVFTCAAYGAAQAATTGSMSCASATGGAGAGKMPASIEINSFQFGTSRSASSTGGSSADRESNLPSVSEIVVTKTQGSTSPNLFKGLAGAHTTLGTCTIKLDKGATSVPYLTYVLTNTLISGYSLSSGGDRPTESLTLNFTKIEFTDKIQNGATTGTTSKPTPSPSPKPKT